MTTPKHDTPHPEAPQGFISHVNVVRDEMGAWVCFDCGCPHGWIPVPIKQLADPECPCSWLVASEARPCPQSFEVPCAECGQTYECADDCPVVLALLGSSEVYVSGLDCHVSIANAGLPLPTLEWFAIEHTEAEMSTAGMIGWMNPEDPEEWPGEHRLWLFPEHWVHTIPINLPVVTIRGKTMPFVPEEHTGQTTTQFGSLDVGLLAVESAP